LKYEVKADEPSNLAGLDNLTRRFDHLVAIDDPNHIGEAVVRPDYTNLNGSGSAPTSTE
jgi:hypothetical protein